MTPQDIEQKIAERLDDDRHKRAVYVFAECEAGPCKIGYSKNPDVRVKAVRKTHNMPNLKVMWFCFHQDASLVELYIHSNLAKQSLGKEIFSVTVETAISVAENMIKKVKPVEQFWRSNPQYLDPNYKPKWKPVSGDMHWARKAKMARLAAMDKAVDA